jgi:hypothetical protein
MEAKSEAAKARDALKEITIDIEEGHVEYDSILIGQGESTWQECLDVSIALAKAAKIVSGRADVYLIASLAAGYLDRVVGEMAPQEEDGDDGVRDIRPGDTHPGREL